VSHSERHKSLPLRLYGAPVGSDVTVSPQEVAAVLPRSICRLTRLSLPRQCFTGITIRENIRRQVWPRPDHRASDHPGRGPGVKCENCAKVRKRQYHTGPNPNSNPNPKPNLNPNLNVPYLMCFACYALSFFALPRRDQRYLLRRPLTVLGNDAYLKYAN